MITRTISVNVSKESIVQGAPPGLVPMLQVVSGYDEFVVGEMVYLKNGHYEVCLTGKRVDKKQIASLRFVKYVRAQS